MAECAKQIHIAKSVAAVTQANCPASSQQSGDMGGTECLKRAGKKEEEMRYGDVGSK